VNPPPPPPAAAPAPAHLEFKAALLLALLVLLLAGSVLYVMYARGVFEATQTLVLVADDSEGVTVGMDVTFSGFPIGRVRRIELGDDGAARIVVDVPRKDARWLRETSVFTLVRGLVGNVAIRAYSGILADPPLPDGAVRKVLVGDATAEIPQLVAATRELVRNVTALTSADSALNATLGNVQEATGRLKGRHGALGVLLGNDDDAKKLVAALERANALLARVDALAARVDGVVAKADAQVFGADGLAPEARAAIVQLNGMLGNARGTLKKADALLADAQAVAANARVASADLGALRAEVEASLRKVERLVDEINRKWPFARDAELRLR